MVGARPLVVIKLGGSLLACDDWPRRLERWLQPQPAVTRVIVCGGGAAVDALRAQDREQAMDAGECHWQAIAEMTRNTLAAAARFPQARVCCCLQEVASGREHGPLVFFDCQPFLKNESPGNGLEPLPQSWDVTSDSIAARVAVRLAAEELVLLKSANPEQRHGVLSLSELSAAGYVDAFFPQAARGLRGRMVNLASDPPADFFWTFPAPGQR